MRKLPREFYERDTLAVAPDLLGKLLVHESETGKTVGKIVEVEAYIGPEDKAAHSYRGLKSTPTQIMFGPAGFIYIYLIYGMYYCLNIVTHKINFPEVVLVRALEPIEGIELMKVRRHETKLKNLCRGPGKLCQAMDLTRRHYGMDLCGDTIYLLEDESTPPIEIETSPRINIDYAGEYKDKPWRFFIKDNAFVSKP